MRLSRSQRIALAVVPPLAALVIRALGATLRYTEVTDEGTISGDRMPRPSIYACWHDCLFCCIHRFRDQNLAIIISGSFDGELIARTVQRLGFHVVRGSSTRGGAMGLKGMERAFREGYMCAITADGPKGPAHVAKPGAAQLAQLVDGSFGACCAWPERCWRLKSWDRFVIPKPFSRVRVAWPRVVPAGEVTEAAVQAAIDRSYELAQGEMVQRFEA